MITKRKTIFKRVLVNYTLAILGIIVLFEIYFITNARNQVIDGNVKNNQIVGEEDGNYIKKISDTSDLIVYKLYQSDGSLSDTILFLENNLYDYNRKKLDDYASSASSDYQGMDDFAIEAFGMSSQLERIAFVSYKEKNQIAFGVNGDIRNSTVSTEYLKSLENEVLVQNNDLTFVKQIQNPLTMENIGYLMITYSGDYFKEAYKNNSSSELIVFYKDKEIIYDSTGKKDVSNLLNENGVIVNQERLEKELDAYVSYYGVNGINIIRYIPKSKAEKVPVLLIVYLMAMGIILFSISELFVSKRLQYLTKRLNTLLAGMERVKEGDMDAFVSIKPENDEYDVIAENFNKMCVDLKTYIQKSYLAEIDQKNAEINALQSQINPHFLYNTLEVIRMKAICNGDTEVGKMLYGLAFIFRSQIKESDIITIAKELYYCKKYLELFEFRYQNKFTFEILYKDEDMCIPIIKFIVQPLIENYFVHGIRLRDNDNFLKIQVVNMDGIIEIIVDDNGRGMTPEEMDQMNQKLSENSVSVESIGISNVHRRIVASYGQKYGARLDKSDYGGIRVILRFPQEVTHV